MQEARENEALLRVQDLGRRFGGLTALRGFALSMGPGELVGLIGPNGAGKTTAFNLISGVLRPSTGHIVFADEDVTRAPPQRRARLGMTRTFQNVRLFDELTVLENVMAGAHLRLGTGLAWAVLGGPVLKRSERAIRARADEVLSRVGMVGLAQTRAGELSYGDRRRIEIARALATGPRLILLDEPAAGMNESETAALGRLIRHLHEEAGIAVVLVEHNVSLVARLCPRVVVLHRGERLADGPPAEVLRRAEVAEAYLGRRHAARETGGPIHAQP
jgi:branched-chain amino acid transport system ATP-binding protein